MDGDAARVISGNVAIVGNVGVGKTALAVRYVYRYYTQEIGPTVRFAFYKYLVSRKGYQLLLNIWDTAGYEYFRSLAPYFYRKADCIIIAFQAGYPQSLAGAERWLYYIKDEGYDTPIVLAATMCDVKVSPDEYRAADERLALLQHGHGLAVFNTSSLLCEGVSELFEHVCDVVVDRLDKRTSGPTPAVLDAEQRRERNGRCC